MMQRNRMSFAWKMVVTIGAALLIASVACAAEKVWPRRNAVVEAVEKAGPAVVNIGTERIVEQRYAPSFDFRRRFFDDPFEDFFKRFHSRRFRTMSLGSGVIIDSAGYVVTNEHVISRASKIHVNLKGGKTYEGKLVNSDPDNDIAIIKIDVEGPLPTARMGTSSDLMIGETVIAIGNPFGFESSVSVGVVSAINRSIQSRGREVMKGLVQTDAAINPGNSGGALVNINGELIGINTAIYAKAQNIGFAIPVGKVKTIMGQMLDYRVLRRMLVGVDAQELTAELGRQVGAEPGDGVLVAGVQKGSPAADAGIKPLDVITEADGRRVSCLFDLRLTVLKHKAGDELRLKLRRGGKTQTRKLRIAEIPPPDAKKLAREKFGLILEKPTRKEASRLPYRALTGLVVRQAEPRSPAARAGVRVGDVIIQIGGISTAGGNLGFGLEMIKPGQSVYFVLIRGNARYHGLLKAR